MASESVMMKYKKICNDKTELFIQEKGNRLILYAFTFFVAVIDCPKLSLQFNMN